MIAPPGRREPTSVLIETLLQVAREATGMDVAWLSTFRDGEQVFDALSGEAGAFGLAPGASRPLGDSYCVRVLDGRLASAVPDTGADPVTRSLPPTAALGIGSYVGVAVAGDHEEPRGMLCCVSRSANGDLGEADVRFLELLSGAIAALLRDSRGDDDRQRRIRDRVGRVIRHGRLQAHLQPIVSLTTGAVVGAEALARFPAEPARPDLWFADAESVGLGTALELAAVDAALKQLPALPPGAYLSVNASARLVCSGQLHAPLAAAGTGRIVVELTEHEAVPDYDELLDALVSLRRSGVRIAIDDVGAGFASFAHVLKLRPDVMKIDISITRGIDHDLARRGLARGIVNMARDTGATVVAEGVETQAELDTLLHLGVDAAQGWFLARPGPAPLPTVLPRPTSHLADEAGRLTSGHDVLGFIARSWFAANDLETVVRPVLDGVLDRTGMESSYLTVIDAATGQLERRYVRNRGALRLTERLVVPYDVTLCKRCRDARIRWTADVARDLPDVDVGDAHGVTTYISIPVRRPDGTVVGTLCAASTEPRYVAAATLDEIELFARLLGERLDGHGGGNGDGGG